MVLSHLLLIVLSAFGPVSGWRMAIAVATPYQRLGSHSQNTASLWSAPSYTVWWQRHKFESGLVESRARDLSITSPTSEHEITKPHNIVKQEKADREKWMPHSGVTTAVYEHYVVLCDRHYDCKNKQSSWRRRTSDDGADCSWQGCRCMMRDRWLTWWKSVHQVIRSIVSMQRRPG